MQVVTKYDKHINWWMKNSQILYQKFFMMASLHSEYIAFDLTFEPYNISKRLLRGTEKLRSIRIDARKILSAQRSDVARKDYRRQNLIHKICLILFDHLLLNLRFKLLVVISVSKEGFLGSVNLGCKKIKSWQDFYDKIYHKQGYEKLNLDVDKEYVPIAIILGQNICILSEGCWITGCLHFKCSNDITGQTSELSRSILRTLHRVILRSLNIATYQAFFAVAVDKVLHIEQVEYSQIPTFRVSSHLQRQVYRHHTFSG
ncbi:UNKNOWN [Stylonychia lemnae]|uniref:Uncharacterized protein n=1 Tax=Stylonychia lemnae TaxID=5949 RepID=A0A078AA27_STYLE|nr:UNKNOWN [Stylonychia lemnae]|eukprot:CDW79120.1 UNKNOWN [Stylonychia lemnae]